MSGLVAILLGSRKSGNEKKKLTQKLRKRAVRKAVRNSRDGEFFEAFRVSRTMLGFLYTVWINAGFSSNVFFQFVFEQLSINGIVPVGYPRALLTSIICWDVGARVVRAEKKGLYRKVDPVKEVLNDILSSVHCTTNQQVYYPRDLCGKAEITDEVWSNAKIPKGIEFSKRDMSLMKWRVDKFRSKFLFDSHLPPKWVHLLSVWLETAPKEIRSKLASYIFRLFPKLQQDYVYGEEDVINTLKAATTIIKRDIPDSLPGVPGFLIDLHQLGGYDTVLNDTSDLASTWCNAFDDATRLSKTKGRGIILHELDGYIESVVQEWGISTSSIDDLYSGATFLTDRGNWTVSGASTLPGIEVKMQTSSRSGGYEYRSVELGGKELSCLPFSGEELWDYCVRDDGFGESSKPFEKGDEPAKGRVVVNHDIRSYLRCSFLEYFLGRSPDWTALDKGTESLVGLHTTLKTALECGTGVSLDYSGWDHSVVYDLVRLVLRQVEKMIIRAIANSNAQQWEKELAMADVRAAALCEFNSLGSIKFRFANGESPTTTGGFLSSGHKWTALANTMLNRALFLYFSDKIGLSSTVLTAAHQGDDVAVVLAGKDLQAANFFVTRFSEEAKKLGFSINPLKTSVALHGVEFLRYWITNDGSFGYPGRMLKTLCWKKPDSGTQVKKWLTNIQETVDSALVAERRGLENVGWLAARLVESYIPRAISQPQRALLLRWLGTSVGLGGLGAPGFRARYQESNSHVRFIPRLRSDTDVCYKHIKYKSLDGTTNLTKRLPHDSNGVLGLRLNELLRNEIPIKGFQQTLVFDKLADVAEVMDISKLVRTGAHRIPLCESIPPIFPVKGDGIGWWFASILGRDALSKTNNDKFGSWQIYLGRRFKQFLARYNLELHPRAVRWGLTALSPPQAGLTFSEFQLWEERVDLSRRWSPFYAYGLCCATGSQRRSLSYGVRQLFSFS